MHGAVGDRLTNPRSYDCHRSQCVCCFARHFSLGRLLKAEVEATYPYNTNEQPITTNDRDMWSIVQAEDDYDPFPEYLYLGDDVSDRLFGWIQIAINTTQDMSTDSCYAVAAYIDADGVHVETDSLIGGGMGGGNGTAPNGTAPTSDGQQYCSTAVLLEVLVSSTAVLQHTSCSTATLDLSVGDLVVVANLIVAARYFYGCTVVLSL